MKQYALCSRAQVGSSERSRVRAFIFLTCNTNVQTNRRTNINTNRRLSVHKHDALLLTLNQLHRYEHVTGEGDAACSRSRRCLFNAARRRRAAWCLQSCSRLPRSRARAQRSRGAAPICTAVVVVADGGEPQSEPPPAASRREATGASQQRDEHGARGRSPR